MVMETIQSLHTGGNENPVGSNVKVHIMVKDPRGEKPHVLVEPVVKSIQACTECEMNKTISDGGITVDFSIIKVHTSN